MADTYNLAHIRFIGVEVPPKGLRTRAYPGFVGPLRPRSTLTHDELDPFLPWLLEQGGLDGRAYRPEALNRRLSSCLRRLRVATPDSARMLLESRTELVGRALDTVLIGVSEFFRDAPVFEKLRQEVVPELLRTRPGLRVYSAGSSEGQELYSMAILLAEAGVLRTSDLLGVDCRPEAPRRAQEGTFTDDDLRGVNPALRERYFQRCGSAWRAREILRSRLRWRCGDIATEKESGWDVLLFRNVSIYLEEQYAARIWSRLYSQLAPGGFLVTGKAEKPPASLSLSRISPCLYQKIGD